MSGKIQINIELCKGCEFCVAVCPFKIIKMSDKTNKHSFHFAEVTEMKKCSGCQACSIMCPDIAIEVWKE